MENATSKDMHMHAMCPHVHPYLSTIAQKARKSHSALLHMLKTSRNSLSG